MSELPRDDYTGSHFDATFKTMPTGERVYRLRPFDENLHTKRVSITRAEVWDDVDNPPWQKTHYHAGVTEGYLVAKGSMLALWLNEKAEIKIRFMSATGANMIEFKPAVVHNVLLGPGAEILVWQTGTPVPNRDMKDPQDRYPVVEDPFDYDLYLSRIGKLLV